MNSVLVDDFTPCVSSPVVILLNGGSSVGKTSIARALMALSSGPMLLCSVDHLVNNQIDTRFVASDQTVQFDWQKKWFFHRTVRAADGQMSMFVDDGSCGLRLHRDAVDVYGAFVAKGYSLIVDEVLLSDTALFWYLRALHRADRVYVVHVTCALEIAVSRELMRKDRYIGLARGTREQLADVDVVYDLVIDTSTVQAEVGAHAVLDHIERHAQPVAYEHMVSRAVRFERLHMNHLDQLYVWLNDPVVKTWWEPHGWTREEIQAKYASYVDGFKVEHGKPKPMYAFCCYFGDEPMGYIQLYDVRHFDPSVAYAFEHLEQRCASFDWFIGVPEYRGIGLAVRYMKKFLKEEVWPRFDACVVGVVRYNSAAINVLRRVGFEIIGHDEKSVSVILYMRRAV